MDRQFYNVMFLSAVICIFKKLREKLFLCRQLFTFLVYSSFVFKKSEVFFSGIIFFHLYELHCPFSLHFSLVYKDYLCISHYLKMSAFSFSLFKDTSAGLTLFSLKDVISAVFTCGFWVILWLFIIAP